MSNLKDQLVRLGAKRKDLRPHIRPVLAQLQKEAGSINTRDTINSVFGQIMDLLFFETIDLGGRQGLTGAQVSDGMVTLRRASDDPYDPSELSVAYVSFTIRRGKVYGTLQFHTSAGQQKDTKTLEWSSNESFVRMAMDVVKEADKRLD